MEEELARASAEAASAGSRADRLAHGQPELEDANRQLTAENARLTLANEEFLVSSEELQASNEELETLNEELQATVEELSTANEDLQARSAEAQDLVAASQAERSEAERGRDRLRVVLASMASALVVLDPEGHAVLTNAEYDRTFGSELRGLRVEDQAGQSLPAEAWPWRRAASDAPFRTEFVVLDPEGRRRWFEALSTPLRVDLFPGQEGSSGGTVLAIRDITDRSVRQLHDEFLLNVSHELRTPLTSLALYADLIARQAGEAGAPPRLQELAGALVGQAHRLRGLVEELVDASRIERRQLTLQRAEVDLTAVLHGVVDAARVLPGGEAVRLHVPDAPLRVQGDAGRLQQVFMNLVDNALKYAGGEQPIDLRLRAIGGDAEVEVQDYGRGIPAAELPLVFTRFHRATGARDQAPEGLGLGLYITREIVAAHGGGIEVQSVEGEGTLFRIRLPLSPERDDI